MDLVYRFLGIVARFNEQCSKCRIHFVFPFNLIIGFVLGVVLFVLYQDLPSTTSVGALASPPAVYLIALMVVISLFEIALVVTACTCYVVFRRTEPHSSSLEWRRASLFDSPPAPANEKLPSGVRATGLFTASNGSGTRFLEMPASPIRQADGLSFASLISFRSNFFGIPLAKNQSRWTIDIPQGSARNCTKGLLYLGFTRRHALWFSYTPSGAKRPQSLVLSFNDEADRETILTALTHVERGRAVW